MAFDPKLARLDRTKKDFAHRPKWMEAAGDKFKKDNGSPYIIMNGMNVAWVPIGSPRVQRHRTHREPVPRQRGKGQPDHPAQGRDSGGVLR